MPEKAMEPTDVTHIQSVVHTQLRTVRCGCAQSPSTEGEPPSDGRGAQTPLPDLDAARHVQRVDEDRDNDCSLAVSFTFSCSWCSEISLRCSLGSSMLRRILLVTSCRCSYSLRTGNRRNLEVSDLPVAELRRELALVAAHRDGIDGHEL